MFMFRKKAGGKLFAAVSGKAKLITEVDDEVFAEKIIGDGVAIVPAENAVVSPVNGKVSFVADTCHGIGITAEDGAEILIHIGINTVMLNGEGFVCHIKQNQSVRVGTPLCTVDFPALQEKGYETDVILVLQNPNDREYTITPCLNEEVLAGKTCVAEYA